MKNPVSFSLRWALWAVAGLAWALPTGAVRAADTYTLGTQDVVAITVWEHPEMSRNATIRSDGMISVPPLGDLPARGKTTTDLAQDLENALSRTLRITAQVTVSVAEYNSRSVSVAGQVDKPGRYAYETFPSLVDVLGQAGGLSALADLSRVRILRQGKEGPQTFTVDVSRAVQTGDLIGVPALESGDVIFVPALAGAGTAAGGTGVAPGSETIYVLGEVARPGAYPAIQGMGLLQALSLAGGLTPRGNLGEVEVISGAGQQESFRIRVDLEREMAQGKAGLPLMAGDVVLVESRGANAGAVAWGVIREALGVTRDAVNIILIRDSIKK